MFRFHDQTRRQICLVSFLALGFAPALAIGIWCVFLRLPGRINAEAQWLSQRLGLAVKIGDMRPLRPGATLYEQFEAADPETGQPVFRCRILELSRQKKTAAPNQSRDVLTITASQPQLEVNALGRFWLCLQRIMDGSGGNLDADVQFTAGELTLHDARNPQTLIGLSGTLERLSGGIHAVAEFRLAGVETPEPVKVRLVRNRQIAPPAGGFELYTGGGELPCSLLALGIEQFAPLGLRCRFRGYIWANQSADGWHGEITGQMVELDLGRLVGDHFPHKLTGQGEMTIQSARFSGGRLERGSAILKAGPGMIDRSLLAAAIERFGLTAGHEPLPDGPSLPYDQLALAATLDAEGLHVEGRCPGVERGTILSRQGLCMLGEPLEQPTPVAALVQTLVPSSVVQVPAGRQTDWLLRHLPVPEIVPPTVAEPIPPHARLRLRDTWQR